MEEKNRTGITVMLISCGTMLGTGLGATYGNVALGICAGAAVGALIAIVLHTRSRRS